MHKKKIAVMTMAIIISNFSAATLEVLADEISNNTSILEINDNKEVTKAVVSKFDLYNSDKLNDYKMKQVMEVLETLHLGQILRFTL